MFFLNEHNVVLKVAFEFCNYMLHALRCFNTTHDAFDVQCKSVCFILVHVLLSPLDNAHNQYLPENPAVYNLEFVICPLLDLFRLCSQLPSWSLF